ncbi:MAG: hypothetical protein ABI380_09490, partial [Edaphobacter sp.]
MTQPIAEFRIAKLEQNIRNLSWICGMQTLIVVMVIVATLLTNKVEARTDSKVLRARGLIIEDNQGRARIVLGAPLPALAERKRQGSLTNSMIFLDESGFDQLTLGEGPDPLVNGLPAHRISKFTGVLIHDSKGNERGGYGWLSSGRAVVTLDRPGL